ncbi:MAG: hypothetical protein PHY23_06140 [Oscillospiraceae bacterium]|jgi:hypothetical protein|nr:hypothetical protein [Oscillospiraceae bacterium]
MAGNTDYKRKFTAEKYDRIEITVPKGKKEVIKNCAVAVGESVNRYINRAIDDRMEQDYRTIDETMERDERGQTE